MVVVPPAAAPAPVGDDVLQSSAALLARGFITPAASEDVESIRAELAGRLSDATLLGVYAVDRGSQRNVYDALRTSLEESRGGVTPAERELWHGTSWAIMPKILRQGFNRSFAGRHGTMLGMATYFSTDIAYSQRFCDRRGGGKDGTKVMLRARVVVGNFCRGSATDVEPPVADLTTGERYDSTVDNEEKPAIFAVFRDFQAVPLFLVEFRT